VGEHSATVRRRAAERLVHLGVAVDPDADEDARPDTDISAPYAKVRTLVIAAREDIQIAHEVRSLEPVG